MPACRLPLDRHLSIHGNQKSFQETSLEGPLYGPKPRNSRAMRASILSDMDAQFPGVSAKTRRPVSSVTQSAICCESTKRW